MRSRVLFITPIMPQDGGNGLAMRAGMTLQALAAHHAVDLLVLPVAGGAAGPPPFVTAHAERIGRLPLDACIDAHAGLIERVLDPAERRRHRLAYPRPWLSRFSTPRAVAALRTWLGGAQPAIVHVMRLYLAPLADAWRGVGAAAPRTVLDLDDDDGRTARGLAALHAAAGDDAAAAMEHAEADKSDALATRWLPYFDRVLTCSAGDAQRLAVQHPGARFAVLPNGYPPRDALPPRVPHGEGPRLLFVGTLDYLPNTDAVRWLAEEIVPALARLRPAARIDIVGPGASPALAAAAAPARLVLHGRVDRIDHAYLQADIAIVPLRAGGGTRIKILEAFAHGVPVVATGIGAEGLGLVPEQHYLRADDAAAIAEACCRLHADPALAHRLVTEAAALLRQRFAPACIQAALAGIYAAMEHEVQT